MAEEESISLALLARVRDTIQQHAGELDQSDAAAGDGDHGRNLAAALDAALHSLQQQTDRSLAASLQVVAGALAAACRAAAETLSGREQPDARDVAAAFEAAVEAVHRAGGAVIGDKTMADVLRPAADALRVAVEDGADLATALDRAAASAHAGLEQTLAQPGTTGQAARLGEGAIGHRDPGATSAHLIVRTLADAARSRG